MKRRTFITLIAGAAASPLVARAQQPTGMRRIGVLMQGSGIEPDYQSYLATFRQGLHQLGWVEGQNVRIEVRWSASNADLARTYAGELIGLKPDVVLASTTLNLTMMREATRTVPVVFVAVADPVKQRFVESISHPGGNLTGFSLFEFSMGGKWIGLLKDVMPALERVNVMFNPETSPQTRFFMSEIEAKAPSLGVKVTPMPVRAFAEIEPALASLAGQSNVGLILPPDIFLNMQASQIAELLGRYRIPTIAATGQWKNGVLMIYGNEIKLVDQFRQSATYVDRILKGSKPGDLPVQGADSYGLIVNLKAAKALGLTVPHQLLNAADEVIE